ncbi:MAG: hypothetical protein ACFFDQ_04230 [Candidatus Thorarchaeota archaeon]
MVAGNTASQSKTDVRLYLITKAEPVEVIQLVEEWYQNHAKTVLETLHWMRKMWSCLIS